MEHILSRPPLSHHWKRADKFDRALSTFYSLTGGVIFATVFLDVIPHVESLLSKYETDFDVRAQFPITYFLISVGLLLTYFFEEGTSALWRCQRQLLEDEPYKKRSKRRKDVNIMVAAVTFAVAISVHSFLEGFTLFQTTTMRIVELLLALLLYKIVDSISSESNHREKAIAIVTAILVFALVIPLGTVIGSLVDTYELSDHTQDVLILIFESLAGGIFIYVAMFEIIGKQRHGGDNILHLWVIFTGFMLIAVLHLIFGTLTKTADYSDLLD